MSEPKPCYTVEDLKRWNEVAGDLTPPARLAVIGDPVEHSLSPQMHNAALQACGIDAQYVRVHVKSGELADSLPAFAEAGFIGVNVTIPHKAEAAKLIDRVDPLADRIGAVNTILFEDGATLGFNSDAPGFRQAIRDEFFMDLRDLRVLILGAGGGAGRAVTIQCAEDHCERLLLVNRTLEKAEALRDELIKDFSDDRVSAPVDRLKALPWEEDALEEEMSYVDLIVNATNLGMKRSDAAVLPESLLQPHHLIYDMVYSPPTTRLMESGRASGARVTNGLGMLLWQGAISFEYWFNRQAPVTAMRSALRKAL